MRFFISYCTSDGLAYARQTKKILGPSHDGWVWHEDRTLGAYTWAEIGSEIKARDIIVFIITPGSAASEAQRREVNLALNLQKRVFTFAREDAEVYVELKATNYERFSDSDFAERFGRVAGRSDVETAPSPQLVPSGYRARLLEIQGLRSRTSALDAERLASAVKEARQCYLRATVPRHVVKFDRQRSPDGSFQRISVEETRSLATFNDPSYIWNPYFSDCGRIVALGEKTYLFDTLSGIQQAPRIEATGPADQYAAIDKAVTELAHTGFTPQTLFAPVRYMTEFLNYFEGRVNWAADDHVRLHTPSGELRIYWSSQAEHFTVLSPGVGIWRVVPDIDTGEALTVAVGASALYPDLIQIIVQSYWSTQSGASV